MQSNNPVFARMSQPAQSGAGFAYDEGVSAYNAAGQAARAGTTYPSGPAAGSVYAPTSLRMTIDDVVVKTGICLFVLVAGAIVGWNTATTMPMLLWIASLLGFGLAMVNIFKKSVSPVLVLAYALAQGIFLGGLSFIYNEIAAAQNYYGLVQQAVLGTLVAFAVMLALYRSQLVKVDSRFVRIMLVAMVSYLVIALASLVSSFFGVGAGWGFYGVGTLGIVLCVIGVALASFSLMMDFESIKQGVRMGLPERESWRMAFGLLVTLIWLYVELLRLLMIIASNRD